MRPRIAVITLGVDDLGRALQVYRDGLGLPPAGDATDRDTVTLALLEGVRLALRPLERRALDAGLKDNNQELVAQGLTNIAVPFFGGVPVTAAVARTSVGIKSGGRTRLVSVVHGLVLLVAALLAGSLIARTPLAALGGVLLVTAVRMNEWETIRFFVHRRLTHALVAMVVTMLATVVLDLTQAIVIGVAVSALTFLRQSSDLVVSRDPVDAARQRGSGHDLARFSPDVQVSHVSGPLFFGSVAAFLESLEGVPSAATLVLSMRGVPTVDAMGVQALEEVLARQTHGGGGAPRGGATPGGRTTREQWPAGSAWAGACAPVHRSRHPRWRSGAAGGRPPPCDRAGGARAVQDGADSGRGGTGLREGVG